MRSFRSDFVTRRTYNRPLNDQGTIFESWEQTVARVIDHQRWLWERAITHKVYPEIPLKDITEDMSEWIKLSDKQELELIELEKLFLERKASLAGRTLWLGGTWVAKNREASQFNCAFVELRTVYDVVDMFWLLLQGAGVGFRPVAGSLTGFRKMIPTLTIIPSERDTKGIDYNEEYFDYEKQIWYIKVGDSAEAWAKSLGKILAGKYPASELVIDCTEIRPAGHRLKNYGWISQGYQGLVSAYSKIFEVMNRRADALLTEMDILDIGNLMGTVLSTRRSAEIAVLDYTNPAWHDFATAKKDMYEIGNGHRDQSNNSIIFWDKPTKQELTYFMELINSGGNGEPGLINGVNMKSRAPWAVGVNPCAEILLGDGSFCCLSTIDVAKFRNDRLSLHRAGKLIARANYRQTCVDLRDGVLQEKWHLNQDFLRLCGVSMMGVVMSDLKDYDYTQLRRTVTTAAYNMAKELGTPYPKNVTTIKPEGTISKCFDSTEGANKPLGKYIFNNIGLSKYDPLCETLKKGNYRVVPHPTDPSGVLVTLPVKYDHVEFDLVDGTEVNLDSAIAQLERYKKLMMYWCDQNVSITVSYDVSETPAIIDWLWENWDIYVAVSFLFRNDPTKTAKDLGYAYLPQEVVTKETYDAYVKQLLPVDLNAIKNMDLDDLQEDCESGACPIR